MKCETHLNTLHRVHGAIFASPGAVSVRTADYRVKMCCNKAAVKTRLGWSSLLSPEYSDISKNGVM